MIPTPASCRRDRRQGLQELLGVLRAWIDHHDGFGANPIGQTPGDSCCQAAWRPGQEYCEQVGGGARRA